MEHRNTNSFDWPSWSEIVTAVGTAVVVLILFIIGVEWLVILSSLCLRATGR